MIRQITMVVTIVAPADAAPYSHNDTVFSGNSLACPLYHAVAAFASPATATGACLKVVASSQACM
jgi:hypothetical protein